jgi:hypothetical protein
LTVPSQSTGPSFPRLATLYSKVGQNTAVSQSNIARFNLYVADMINWPSPSAVDPSISQGEYYKRANPGLIALMYFHACLYSDTEYTPGQFTVGHTLYYIDPRWYLTYAGSTLIDNVTPDAVRLSVQDLRPFAVGDRLLLGGVEGQSQPELSIVVDKSAPTGPGELMVTRGVLSQGGRYAPSTHIAGDYVRPVAHAFGSPEAMLLNPTGSGVASDVNSEFGLQTWNQFVATFLTRKLADPAFANIDGYMLDNFVDRATALVDEPQRVDLSNTNTASGLTDRAWADGMRDLVARVRSSLPPNRILTSNDGGGDSQTFGEYLSGGMIEGIDQDGAAAMHGGVEETFGFYSAWISHANRPSTFIFEGSPRVGELEVGASAYQAMRFLLTLALTDDGYFAFDEFNINAGHQTLWWYDEYDDAGQGTGYLGRPLGPASQPIAGVFRRDFANGISLSNTTKAPHTIALGDTFRKIKGTQAATVNDGSAVTSVTLMPKDGIILLR